MKPTEVKAIVAVCKKVGYYYCIHEGYSGRYMYGEQTPAVELTRIDYRNLLQLAAIRLGRVIETRIDDMGRDDVILY